MSNNLLAGKRGLIMGLAMTNLSHGELQRPAPMQAQRCVFPIKVKR